MKYWVFIVLLLSCTTIKKSKDTSNTKQSTSLDSVRVVKKEDENNKGSDYYREILQVVHKDTTINNYTVQPVHTYIKEYGKTFENSKSSNFDSGLYRALMQSIENTKSKDSKTTVDFQLLFIIATVIIIFLIILRFKL